MDEFWRELSAGMPSVAAGAVEAVKVLCAALVGGALGYERQLTGKEAGLRTHMLVCLGSCVFVMAVLSHDTSLDGVSRVVQGIATGIGFVGAGAILKLVEQRNIKGLTTAANIWFTAALGVAVGLGRFWLALAGTAVAWFILSTLEQLEKKLNLEHPPRTD